MHATDFGFSPIFESGHTASIDRARRAGPTSWRAG